MKSSIIKTVLAFVAGAGCATVIAGYEGEHPIPPDEWLRTGNTMLVTISQLGGQVSFAEKGLVHLHPFSVAACMVPPPKPKQTDLRTFDLGVAALRELYKAQLAGNPEPIRMTDRCHPY
jgi:hypothetical protein